MAPRDRKSMFGYGEDDDDIKSNKPDPNKISRLSEQRALIIKDKNMELLTKLFTSKLAISEAAKDKTFLGELDEAFPDKKYAKKISETDLAYRELSEESDDEKVRRAAKMYRAISTNGKMFKAIGESMEEPGRSMYQALIDAILAKGYDLVNTKMTKEDDDTNLDLDKVFGDESPISELVMDSVTKSDSEEAKKAFKVEDKVNQTTDATELNNIKVTDKSSLIKLGEKLAIIVHGDKYSRKILDDVIDHGISKVGASNWKGLASYLKEVYRAAYAPKNKNMSERVQKCFSRLDTIKNKLIGG